MTTRSLALRRIRQFCGQDKATHVTVPHGLEIGQGLLVIDMQSSIQFANLHIC